MSRRAPSAGTRRYSLGSGGAAADDAEFGSTVIVRSYGDPGCGSPSDGTFGVDQAA